MTVKRLLLEDGQSVKTCPRANDDVNTDTPPRVAVRTNATYCFAFACTHTTHTTVLRSQRTAYLYDVCRLAAAPKAPPTLSCAGGFCPTVLLAPPLLARARTWCIRSLDSQYAHHMRRLLHPRGDDCPNVHCILLLEHILLRCGDAKAMAAYLPHHARPPWGHARADSLNSRASYAIRQTSL